MPLTSVGFKLKLKIFLIAHVNILFNQSLRMRVEKQDKCQGKLVSVCLPHKGWIINSKAVLESEGPKCRQSSEKKLLMEKQDR